MKTKTLNTIALAWILSLLILFQWACKKDETTSPPLPVQSTFTDPRDGKVYPTITVDSLTWFAENLDYDTAGAVEPSLKSTTATNLGKLYKHSSAQVACPPGWHLSTDGEWKALLMHLGMTSQDAGAYGWHGTDQGKKLKSTDGWADNGNGTDLIGFHARPAGWIDYYGEHKGLSEYAEFWTSTPYGADGYYTRGLVDSRDDIAQGYMTITGSTAASVRCVKDVP